MPTDQPEALRLADALADDWRGVLYPTRREAAALLRQQHALIEQMRRAIEAAQDALSISLNPAGAWPMQVKAAQIGALELLNAAALAAGEKR